MTSPRNLASEDRSRPDPVRDGTQFRPTPVGAAVNRDGRPVAVTPHGLFCSRTGRSIKALSLIGLGAGLYHLVQFVRITLFWVNLMHDPHTIGASARNGRGDEVFAGTNMKDNPDGPGMTFIRLKRVHHFISTELFFVMSYGMRVGLTWQDNNTLVLQLDFDCRVGHADPVESVGPIHILYRFGDRDPLPANGYAVMPGHDVPQEPCR